MYSLYFPTDEEEDDDDLLVLDRLLDEEVAGCGDDLRPARAGVDQLEDNDPTERRSRWLLAPGGSRVCSSDEDPEDVEALDITSGVPNDSSSSSGSSASWSSSSSSTSLCSEWSSCSSESSEPARLSFQSSPLIGAN